MGAEFDSRTYSTKKPMDKNEVQKRFSNDQDECRHENGHSYSGGIGMAPGLEFPDVPMFETLDDADQWVADNAEKWENALGVFFKTKTGEIRCFVGAWCSS